MKQKNTILILLLQVLLIAGKISFAQAPPFYDDIQAFKRQDSLAAPAKNAILFIGSSSFTNWKDVSDYFPAHTIINRGFGGSTLVDVIRFAGDIIKPYQPKQIVIYCGENDLASSDTVTANLVLSRFKQLFTAIRKIDPKVPVAFVSLKPSPSRKHLWAKMKMANRLIKSYLATQKKAAYVDVYTKMFNPGGSVMQQIFLEDDLHMNATGYAIWKKAIEPYLIK